MHNAKGLVVEREGMYIERVGIFFKKQIDCRRRMGIGRDSGVG